MKFFKIKKTKQNQIDKDLLFIIKSAIESTSLISKVMVKEVKYNPDVFVFEIICIEKINTNPQNRKGFNSQIQRQFEINGINIPYFIVWEKDNDWS